MTEKENATISVATTDDGKETSLQDNNVSGIDNTTVSERHKGQIESLLKNGSKNAQKMNDLMRLSGISSARQFYSQVSFERQRNNAPILADKRFGYYLPDKTDDGQITESGYRECIQFRDTSRRTARSLVANTECVETIIKDYKNKNQLSLFEELENII